MGRIFLTFLIISFPGWGFSQVNAYAKVTAIAGDVLSLSNVNQTFGSFAPGEQVIIIQMQGASIGGNTSNNSSFGNLSSLGSAGLYEVAIVSAVNTTAGSMTLSANPMNSYNVAGGVQVISYPTLGTSGFTTTSNIGGVPWNGDIGGVIAFNITGNLHLKHRIDANYIGFNGGSVAGQDSDPCESGMWRTSSGNDKYADKGEGIYITTSFQRAGRAKAINGGGGGIVHNGGGGGGGNFTNGGAGAYGFPGDGCSNGGTNAGGQGGLAIASSPMRVFMGGGGGGGQENDSQGTSGADGGGIIMIKADTIVVTAPCSPYFISANGQNGQLSGQDGSGGGGAGGSVILDVKGFRIAGACPLRISADGGNGGSVTHPDIHGSGGGGGQGAVMISAIGSYSNTNISTNFGLGGAVNSSSVAYAGSGGGPANAGVFTGSFNSPLPVELVEFDASESEPGVVRLIWWTASEKNNKQFHIFHSTNGADWNPLGTVKGSGTRQSRTDYNYIHNNAVPGTNYYRLQQEDLDGKMRYSQIAYADITDPRIRVKLFPNPVHGMLLIMSEEDISGENIYLMNIYGVKIPVALRSVGSNRYEADLSGLEAGMYILIAQRLSEKLIVK